AGGLAWLGIYYREGSFLYYWVDTGETGVGYPFFYATPAHLVAFDEGRVQRVQYIDEFGAQYGFVAPIVVEGHVMGIVEALVSQETRELVQREAWASVLPILIGGIVVAIIFSLLITQYVFSEPLNRLRDGALMLASGQFGHQIQLPSNDELGELAGTFNQMSTQIERLYLERVREERTRREREVARLQESERILEAKVAERTAELASKNEALLRSQEELAAAHDQALSASSAKSAFLARMSHELRTPLNVVIGYADILRIELHELGREDLVEHLDQVQKSARHILVQVNEVLDLSKIEAGRMELYVETIDVAVLLNDVAATIEPLVQKNDNTLEVRCDLEVGEMLADPTKIRQSLLNLLSNATKFTQDGLITLSAAREPAANGSDDWIRFAVSDTGVGIPPEKLGSLFEEYVQVDAATGHTYGGTGLGLAITRRFCELMGGQIDVTSDGVPGKGVTFTIRLPVKVDHK
ncbi:MAG TPA: ATP-binding protein, partial [Anaerolineales bacterium]|nr:ATP-binding protein [Anaerolineales bacterium]